METKNGWLSNLIQRIVSALDQRPKMNCFLGGIVSGGDSPDPTRRPPPPPPPPPHFIGFITFEPECPKDLSTIKIQMIGSKGEMNTLLRRQEIVFKFSNVGEVFEN